uniref:PGG domain-containing protein n=1 Tax=Aegilops tauschii subsp. strangulata TaxID=200361 RepID=A0A453QHL8_AEGTS
MPPSDQVVSPNPMGSDSNKPSTEYQLKKYLLLATLVATVTYAAGLNLPGWVWADAKEGHLAGDLILHDTHYHRYLAFYYCNATAFAASVVVCLLLLILNSESKAWAAALRVLMVLDLLGLMGAYAAGSCRDTFTTIYSSVIMSAILLYIMIAFFVYVFSGNPEKQAEDPKNHKREDQHEVLMLLATFVVTITYVAGLNPPGGFWSNSKDGHLVSNPIMQEHNSSRYQAFFVCNTTAFVSSLLIIILLLDKKLILSLPSLNLNKSSARFVALYGFIVIALFGLVGAYAAGSCREPETTTYVVCLIGAVLAYISLQVVITKAITENNRDLFVEPESSSLLYCLLLSLRASLTKLG